MTKCPVLHGLNFIKTIAVSRHMTQNSRPSGNHVQDFKGPNYALVFCFSACTDYDHFCYNITLARFGTRWVIFRFAVQIWHMRYGI